MQTIRRRLGRTPVTIVAILVLLALGVSAVAAATVVDLDANNSGELNGAKFYVGTLPNATGTGVFNPFLRVSSNTLVEQGYNTDYRYSGNKLEFDADASWTKALPLNQVPVVKYEGAFYREFVLDVNQKANEGGVMISLDQLKIFASSSNLVHDFDVAGGNFFASGGGPLTPLYDLGAGNYVKINADKAAASGSGTSDVTMLLPESTFVNYPNCGYGDLSCGTYIYFWSRFGDTYGNNDGFEEWATLVRPTLKVTKTADTSYTQPYDWTIEKSVDPKDWKLFTGESGESQYTVKVTKAAGTPSNFVVSGSINVQNTTNSTKVDTILKDVKDMVDATDAVVTCPVTFPYKMAKDEIVVCTYTLSLAAATPTTKGTNTATAILDDDTTFTGKANYDFKDATITPQNGSISVSDTNAAFAGPKTATDTTTWKYNRTFTCDDKPKVDNTATIVGTTKTASASVTIACYDLSVEKTATTYWERKWEWSIKKVGDQTALKLMPDETFMVNYEVTVDVAKKTDSGFKVSGKFTVINTTPLAATINSVKDVLTPGDIGATILGCKLDDAGSAVTFPYVLAAGHNLVCAYEKAVADTAVNKNTATATQQLHNYPFGKPVADDGTKDVSGNKAVTWSGTPDVETDECIDVTDSKYGALGTVCAKDAPKTFKYSLKVGPYTLEQCGKGPYEFKNCASFVTNDTKATGEACWTVTVEVPCPGCTLTQGYWKTHNPTYGNATINWDIYDKAWGSGACWDGDCLDKPNGEKTAFFHSNQTWGEVMWTPPSKGNAYYILAHQWIAAFLNVLNGASLPTAVGEAWNAALVEFEKPTMTPAYDWKADPDLREKFIMWAGILGSYNEGMEGVPHCDD